MTGTQLAPTRPQDEADTKCVQCGAELADDQEWCLECGGARTLIHRGPDWRVPLAVIAAVIAVAIGGFVVVVISLSNATTAHTAAGSTGTAAARPSANGPAPTARTGTGTATAVGGSGNIATWEIGLPGWTVVLAADHTRRAAYADAERLAGQGIDVGVLDSSQHPRLRPGYWIVFSGRYATRAAAASASAQLVTLGQTHAHPRLVGRPGGP